ncbi:MAG: plasmid maintenance toxin (PemK-like) [Devosia sp.]
MKIPSVPPVGHVIAYEYLWASQADLREDGGKVYPCAVVMAVDTEGPHSIAYVLGISHSPPQKGQRAIEVPPKLKKHLRLDQKPSWIYTGELNVFAWPGPDLRPGEYLSTRPAAVDTCVVGLLPSDWFEEVKAHVLESQRLQVLEATKRTA